MLIRGTRKCSNGEHDFYWAKCCRYQKGTPEFRWDSGNKSFSISGHRFQSLQCLGIKEVRIGHGVLRNSVGKPEEMELERKEEKSTRSQSMCLLQGWWATRKRNAKNSKKENREDENPHWEMLEGEENLIMNGEAQQLPQTSPNWFLYLQLISL